MLFAVFVEAGGSIAPYQAVLRFVQHSLYRHGDVLLLVGVYYDAHPSFSSGDSASASEAQASEVEEANEGMCLVDRDEHMSSVEMLREELEERVCALEEVLNAGRASTDDTVQCTTTISALHELKKEVAEVNLLVVLRTEDESPFAVPLEKSLEEMFPSKALHVVRDTSSLNEDTAEELRALGSLDVVYESGSSAPDSALSSSTSNSLDVLRSSMLVKDEGAVHLPCSSLLPIPSCAWTRTLSQRYPHLREFQIAMGEGIRLLPLGLRIFVNNASEKAAGRESVIDPFDKAQCSPSMGVPAGGIGAGTIGVGWRGEFNRWSMRLGKPSYRTVHANQFSVCVRRADGSIQSSVMSPVRPHSTSNINAAIRRAWQWKVNGNRSQYYALYPRAWTVYEEPFKSLRLTRYQMSPVIAQNYQETSYPVCTFKWLVEDLRTGADEGGGEDDGEIEVRIMFTWMNSMGDKSTAMNAGHFNVGFEACDSDQGNGSKKSKKKRKDKKKKVEDEGTNADGAEGTRKSKTKKKKKKRGAQEEGTAAEGGEKLAKKKKAQRDAVDDLHGSAGDIGPTPHSKPVVGVVLHHRYSRSYLAEDNKTVEHTDPLSFAIAAEQGAGQSVSYCSRWQVKSKQSAAALWDRFCTAEEALGRDDEQERSKEGQPIGAAVCVTLKLKPGESKEAVFSLAWDMPISRFGSGVGVFRRYTRFYGRQGDSAMQLAVDALRRRALWEREIERWQESVVNDSAMPLYYKSALLNELYYLAAGGSVWTDGMVEGQDDAIWYHPATGGSDADRDIGHYLYLESLEYLMYNTYDVHWYASFALAMCWPRLELSLQRDIARATVLNSCDFERARESLRDSQSGDGSLRASTSGDASAVEGMKKDWRILATGRKSFRKVVGCVPHDLGKPSEFPWKKPNSYNFQDISRWKDLNPKFVLGVYRDYVATGDRGFVRDVWPAVKAAMEYCMQFVGGAGDGCMVQNEGFPDQTYDTWDARGTSAYCGGIWVAALKASEKLAGVMEDATAAESYHDLYTKAYEKYQVLWNDSYFLYDSSKSSHHDSVMADQMAGEWFATACGLQDAVTTNERAESSLRAVFQHNVLGFYAGTKGAVNGMRPLTEEQRKGEPVRGTVDKTCLQSTEVWTGTTYAVAAAMMQRGLRDEALYTAKGVIETTYGLGYGFQTPEAWDKHGHYRAIGYMRPLSIWAMQWARERRWRDGKEGDGEEGAGEEQSLVGDAL